ncbi:MAG: class I SAM-dependent rRNA methyltransferase [Chromatiaceae bacterium]|nr:class I SAM-dependent rRNA methyltransferase [Chromatiaceae bacterium]MCP5442593.1 class I SAM-dependent rRNA methyltransferase [Chromatiaceae bacterium]
MNNTPLSLKKECESRLRAGHCWVYSNEVDIQKTPLQSLSPGQPVDILTDQGRWLGSGYANPHSLICARLVSRDPKYPLNASLLVHRVKIALSLRERLFHKPYYRLLYGESDGVPGLVADRFGDVVVIQITTAGMERFREDVVAAVEKVIRPECVILRNDSIVRESEGLERYVEVAKGVLPEFLAVEESGVSFRVAAAEGQKTGWFFDQAFNRARMLKYVEGKRVLDVCSYVGAWGVQAAKAGASDVFCVDSSSAALDWAEMNAQLNGVTGQVALLHGDAFEAMRELRNEQERFDIVMVDPPAFIKRRKDLKEGTLAYRRINMAAMQLLSKDGVLITSSCSHHMAAPNLLQTVQKAARHLDRSLQLLEQGFQSPDHPIHPVIPETAYLKTFYLRVLPTF